MSLKAAVSGIAVSSIGSFKYSFNVAFVDMSTNNNIDFVGLEVRQGIELTGYNLSDVTDAMVTRILAYASDSSYAISASDIVWCSPNMFTNVQAAGLLLGRSFNNTPSHSFVTTAAAGNGFQLSATRDAEVNYSCTIATAATLAAGAVGTIVLEIAATNSSTATDWKEIDRLTNGQVFSLAVAIGCTQTLASGLKGLVPKGYYLRLRTINTTGTPTYTFNGGQEILLPTI